MRSAGFVLAAQVTGKGPLGALGEHLSDPISELPPAAGVCHVLLLQFNLRHCHPEMLHVCHRMLHQERAV